MHCWWRPVAAVWIPWRRASSRRRLKRARFGSAVRWGRKPLGFCQKNMVKTWGKPGENGENMETWGNFMNFHEDLKQHGWKIEDFANMEFYGAGCGIAAHPTKRVSSPHSWDYKPLTSRQKKWISRLNSLITSILGLIQSWVLTGIITHLRAVGWATK